MSVNIPCSEPCEHRNLDNTCMFGVSEDLIAFAKSNKPMCEHLKEQVLSSLNNNPIAVM